MYNDDENAPTIPKGFFRNLIKVTTKESLFTFKNKFHKQIDGVVMGSSLGRALANTFMFSFENKWIKNCPHCLTTALYRHYVYDIFVMFSSLDHAEKLKKYFSLKHRNINFLLEKENDGRLCSLDLNIFCEIEKFVTDVYRIKTFSCVYVISTASYLKPIKPD